MAFYQTGSAEDMWLNILVALTFYFSLRKSVKINTLLFAYTLVLLIYYMGFILSSKAPNIGHANYPLSAVNKDSIIAFKYSVLIFLITSHISINKNMIIRTVKTMRTKSRSPLAMLRTKSRSPLAMLIFLVLGTLLILLTQNSRLIWNASYGTKAWFISPIIDSVLLKNIGILFASMGTFLLLGSNLKQRRILFFLTILFVTYHTLLRGDRGGFITYMSGIMAYLVLRGKYFILTLTIFVELFIAFVWKTLRWQWYYEGLAVAVKNSMDNVFNLVNVLDRDSVIFYTIPVLPQASWHWYHVYDLTGTNGFLGVDRIFVLFMQMVPSFLLDLFDIARPKNLAWLLADYRNHGGGMNHIASSFWIGGYFGVFIWSLIISALFRFILKKFYNYSAIKNFVILSYSLTFVYTFFYGIQPFIKITELYVLILVIAKFYVKKSVYSK